MEYISFSMSTVKLDSGVSVVPVCFVSVYCTRECDK